MYDAPTLSDTELVKRALLGEPQAVRELVARLTPIVQVRVARQLVRRRSVGRDARQEMSDFVQEVFASLFENEGRLLRAWDAERGLSLANFVGLIAERESISLLRSGKRSPWTEEATDADALASSMDPVSAADVHIDSRELLLRIAERVQLELSPRGLEVFHRLFVLEEEVETICQALAMTPGAVYAWRSRIGKLVKTMAAELSADVIPPTRGPNVSETPHSSRIPQGRGKP